MKLGSNKKKKIGEIREKNWVGANVTKYFVFA